MAIVWHVFRSKKDETVDTPTDTSESKDSDKE